MSTNLLELFTDIVGDQISSQASHYLGESESGIKSALGMLLPALLGGAAKQGSTVAGAADLLKTLGDSELDAGWLGNLAGLFSESGRSEALVSLGTTLVKGLFGDRAGALVDTVASVTGLKSSSSSSLLYMIAPLLFSFIKKFVGERGLDATGLMKILAEQVGLLKGTMDHRVSGALGLGSLFEERTAEALQTMRGSSATVPQAESKSLLGKLLPWLLIGAGVMAALAMLRNCKPQMAPEQAVLAPPAPPPEITHAAGPVPASTLAAKIYFAVGAAAIDVEGSDKLAAVAAAARQQGSKLEITGYTDKTGDIAKNEALAKQRALAVRDALVAAGVAPTQISMKPPATWSGTTTGTGSDVEARRVDVSRLP